MKVDPIGRYPGDLTKVHIEAGLEEVAFGAIMGNGKRPPVLRMWIGDEDDDREVFNTEKSVRAGIFYLQTVHYGSPRNTYPVDLLVQVYECEVISVEELTWLGLEEVQGVIRRVEYKRLAAKSLQVGVCLTRVEREAIEKAQTEQAAAEAYEALDAQRRAEEKDKQDAIVRPAIGTATGETLRSLLMKHGTHLKDDDEPKIPEVSQEVVRLGAVEPVTESGDRESRGSRNKKTTPRGNKHAGRGGSKAGRPKYDDERPERVTFH